MYSDRHIHGPFNVTDVQSFFTVNKFHPHLEILLHQYFIYIHTYSQRFYIPFKYLFSVIIVHITVVYYFNRHRIFVVLDVSFRYNVYKVSLNCDQLLQDVILTWLIRQGLLTLELRDRNRIK